MNEMALAPCFLLSMPQLADPNFAKSVILVCEHSAEGAFGLVINRLSELTAAEAVQLSPELEAPNDLPLLIGGPVEPQRGWILTSRAPEVAGIEGANRSDGVLSKEIGAGLHLSASPLLLRRVLQAHPIPRRTVVLAGYAGWGPGQLDAELAESAWLIAPVELDLIFEIPSAVCWEMAMKRLGVDPKMLRASQGIH
jgi:putative transcriptional regulator